MATFLGICALIIVLLVVGYAAGWLDRDHTARAREAELEVHLQTFGVTQRLARRAWAAREEMHRTATREDDE